MIRHKFVFKIKDQHKYTSHRKLVISGNVVELLQYEKPIVRGENRKRKGRAGQTDTTEDIKASNRQKTAFRSKQRVRRLANTNFAGKNAKFVTLTYAENKTSVSAADHDFKTCIQRLTYYANKNGEEFKYIAVREFQERGAVHYHMLCNLPYTENKVLADIWGHGFVNIQSVKDIDNVGAYITKYMTKDVEDERLRGRKSYLCSKDLAEPVEAMREEVIDEILCEIGEVKRVLPAVTYETEHYGEVQYTQIILAEAPDRTRLREILQAPREKGSTGKSVSPKPRGALAQPRGVAAERKQLSLC